MMLRLGGVVMPAALFFAATACEDKSQRAEAFVQQSRTLYDAGDREGAYQAIRSAIALRDDNAAYFVLLGAIQLRRNNAPQAYQAFKQALDLDEANIEALTYTANLGLQLGQVDDASAAADRLLSLNPDSVVGLQVKGLSEMFRDHDDEAERYAQRILKISPRDEAGTIIRARLLAKQNKFDEALAVLDGALASNQSAGILVTKINLYRATRQPGPMADTFDELFKLLPNATAALRLDRINLLYKLGRVDAARTNASDLLKSGQLDLGDYQTLLRIWSEFDPNPMTKEIIKTADEWPDPIALINVCRYLLWQDEPQVASDVFFGMRAGFRPAAEGIRQRSHHILGQSNISKATVEQILARDPEDVDATILNAQYQVEAGQTNLAIEAMQRAVDIDPFDPEVYAILGDLRDAAGAHARAVQVYEDGFKRLPQNFYLIQRYLRFLHKSGDKSRAVSASRSFARSLPSSVKAWSIYETECRWAGNSACLAEAEAGKRNAQTMYSVDEPPGSPPDRGLLSRFQIQGA